MRFTGKLIAGCHFLKGLVWVPLVLMTIVSDLHADAIPDRYGAVTVTDAMVGAASSGKNTILRLRLVNESSETLTVMGVASEQISGARILAATSHGVPEDLGSISILAEETLDLHSAHLKIELIGLKQHFHRGQVIPLTLTLLRGDIPINAHVH